MTTVIEYDFKKKKRIEKPYNKIQFICNVCKNHYNYDSRKDQEKPKGVQANGVFYCAQCLTEMNELIGD